jgi:hypothetical protein
MQGDRWIPDPLVPIDSAYFPPIGAVRLDPGLTHSVWLRFSVGPTAIAGSHQLSVAIQWQAAGSTTSTTITVPVELTVWPAPTTPSRAEYMGAVFAMNTKPHSSIQHGVDLGAYYGTPGVFPPPINQAYVEALGTQRIYADACYLKTPRSIDEYGHHGPCAYGVQTHTRHDIPLLITHPRCYRYLALLHSGAQYVGLLDVSVAASNGTSLQNYTAQQIDAILALLEPIVGELSARGLLKYAYVYGFDERPQTVEWAGGINQMFGSIKNRFPGLRTMAALRWRGRDAAPTGTATLGSIAGTLDVWVQLYSLWDGADAAQWRAYGGAHETWAYHCISPRPAIGPTGTPGPMRWFNTFLESDALDARLLPWWAAANNVTGWLYYSINLWQPEGRPIPKQQLAPLVPIAGSSVFTNFSTVVYNGAANPHDRGAFSNGDGLLIFPGLDGPLSSIRLENFRDGIEDFALLRRLPDVALQSVVDDAVSFRTGWPIAATQILGINATVSPNGLIALRTRAASLVPHPNRYDDGPVTPQ